MGKHGESPNLHAFFASEALVFEVKLSPCPRYCNVVDLSFSPEGREDYSSTRGPRRESGRDRFELNRDKLSGDRRDNVSLTNRRGGPRRPEVTVT